MRSDVKGENLQWWGYGCFVVFFSQHLFLFYSLKEGNLKFTNQKYETGLALRVTGREIGSFEVELGFISGLNVLKSFPLFFMHRHRSWLFLKQPVDFFP